MKTTTHPLNLEIYRILIAAMITALLMITQVSAMPPHPEVQNKIISGEIAAPFNIEPSPFGDVHMKPNAPSQVKGPAVMGAFRALCILVDFSDNQSQSNAMEFDTLVFGNQTNTVRHYYQEVSYGQLDIVTVNLPSALGWQRAPQTYAYYVDNNYGTDSPYPHNSQKLCEDLVDLVDPFVDFSQYDNDANGWVDAVMIVHSGRGAEFTGSSSDIWSHKWSIIGRNKDGVNVSDYTIMPEYWNNPGDMTIGVFCHELGHVFGLPDLYDTDGTSYGTGYWSLMSSGSWNGSLGSSPSHPDAWCRTQLGWVVPNTVSSNATGVSIPAVETTPSVFRLWTSGSVGDEYFLVENRQRAGYDAGLPGDGLLIWHVDDGVYHNNYEWYPTYTDYGHYRVALEQADNLYQLEKKQSLGNNGDPFPGSTSNTVFSPLSSPNSDSYSASSSFVAISNISVSSPVMTADFVVSFAADNNDDDDIDHPGLPRFSLGQNYPNPFNPTTSFDYSISTSGDVEINVFDILGRRVRQIVSGTHQAGLYTATWDGTDESGEGVPSGIYFYELVTEEETTARKMLLLK